MNVDEFLKQFGISRKMEVQLIGRSYFIAEKTVFGKIPVYSGECIAHLRGERIAPSISFLQQIGKEARKHVVVNPKGEWLFICGRDIFSKSIISHNNPEKGDIVVVLNQHRECIGYGEIAAPLNEKNVVVKRIFDIGDLLRREREKRQAISS